MATRDTAWRRTRETVPSSAVINAVWRTSADSNYRAVPRMCLSQFCMIRTVEGFGFMRLRDGRTVRLEPDSLWIFRYSDMDQYWTTEYWNHYLFEFDMQGAMPFRLCFEYRIPFTKNEKNEIDNCYFSLLSPDHEGNFLCQARFNFLMAGWLTAENQVSQEENGSLLRLLEEGEQERIKLTEIARRAGMCERSYRKAIQDITGLTPHEYLNKKKMDRAIGLLCMEGYSVAEVAEKLEFSNPFYFSRAFKNYYGVSPQQVRKNFAPFRPYTSPKQEENG